MRTFLLILLASAAVVSPARALSQPDPQSETKTQILVSEDDGWRVHLGDVPAFAAPNFDDLTWQQTTFGDDLPAPVGQGHSRWFRSASHCPHRPTPSMSFSSAHKGRSRSTLMANEPAALSSRHFGGETVRS